MKNTHPFDSLALDNGAKLIFTPCPGTKGADLSASVDTLQAAGASLIISAMHDEELIKNHAQTLPKECQAREMQWRQLPIIDDRAPEQAFEQVWSQYKDHLVELLKQGQSIAVHCKGGSGRTGLIIALLLIELGWSAQQVVESVQKVRPNALKNDYQRNYFQQYLTR